MNVLVCTLFLSTLPAWGATQPQSTPYSRRSFLSTLPAWGATGSLLAGGLLAGISIHAPRVGSDRGPSGTKKRDIRISIHAPRVGSDRTVIATGHGSGISIHAPRVGSDKSSPLPELRTLTISIHAPRVGSDGRTLSKRRWGFSTFLSTLPAWGATPGVPFTITAYSEFLSTLPAWGATLQHEVLFPCSSFLSTLPAWGATLGRCEQSQADRYFYPRSPRGERHRWRHHHQPV